MFFFSTPILLAVTCSLVKAGFIAERVTTCIPETVHRLSCDSNSVISVETSFYGRADRVTCTEGRSPSQISDTSCSLASASDVVKRRCDGKKVCELNINAFGASDPCRGTAKYLHTNYTCLPASHHVTCEHSLAYLQCTEGQVITVFGADYGRRDQTTCVYGRPASQIENSGCSSPTNKVAQSCNGKNRCTIAASNSVFGDPCPGTFKYLEVAYVCQYTRDIQDTNVYTYENPTEHVSD